jgi:hypothetical protein
VGCSILFFSRLNHAIVVDPNFVASARSSSTGFSLWGLVLARTKIHRLKSVVQEARA